MRIIVPKTTLTAVTSALALVVAAVPVSGLLTGPAVKGAPVTTAAAPAALSEAAQTLTLSTTSAQGTVTWDGKTQTFREKQQCAITTDAGSADLLTLKGFTTASAEGLGTPGFRGGLIGVFEPDPGGDGADNAAKCALVDAGSFTTTETLGLALGGAVKDGTDPLSATEVTVSLIASSKSGSVNVTLFDAAGDAVDPETPRTITWKNGKPNRAITSQPFTGSFSEIRLTAGVGTSFGLTDATFELASWDGVLDCVKSTETLLGVDDNPTVTVTRLNNADDPENESCELIPYTLRNANGEVQFLKPLDEQTTAQFLIDIVWTIRPANTDWQADGSLLPETLIDYEQGGGEIELRWCPDVTRDGDGNTTGIHDVLNNSAAVDQDTDRPNALPGKQFTCIVSQNTLVADGGAQDDYVTMTQQLYLLGDAKMLLK